MQNHIALIVELQDRITTLERDSLRVEMKTMLTPCQHMKILAEMSDPELREKVVKLKAKVERLGDESEQKRFDRLQKVIDNENEALRTENEKLRIEVKRLQSYVDQTPTMKSMELAEQVPGLHAQLTKYREALAALDGAFNFEAYIEDDLDPDCVCGIERASEACRLGRAALAKLDKEGEEDPQ